MSLHQIQLYSEEIKVEFQLLAHYSLRRHSVRAGTDWRAGCCSGCAP